MYRDNFSFLNTFFHDGCVITCLAVKFTECKQSEQSDYKMAISKPVQKEKHSHLWKVDSNINYHDNRNDHLFKTWIKIVEDAWKVKTGAYNCTYSSAMPVEDCLIN